MPVAIKLPDMGTNVEECKILTWRVQGGDAVKRGDVLADVETDKAVVELESTAEGIVLQLLVNAGDTARTGDVLAYVGKLGESISGEPKAKDVHSGAPLQETEVPPASSSKSQGGPSVRVSPVVRNLAAKLGIDLGTLAGTGPGGVITREDVQRASREKAVPASETPSLAEPLPRAQAAVARAVEKSWKEIPHLSVTASIDMTRALDLRTRTTIDETHLSYDALFLKAMGLAAEGLPLVVARFDGERVIRPQGIHIAIAIGVDNELQLPVIRDVEKKNVETLHREVAVLAADVKAHTLRAGQMTGATMALSNLGMYPIEAFDAIIFPEHSTILTVGAIQPKPVVRDGEVKVRPLATVKLAADHRLINGRTAAKFLSRIKEIIESGELG